MSFVSCIQESTSHEHCLQTIGPTWLPPMECILGIYPVPSLGLCLREGQLALVIHLPHHSHKTLRYLALPKPSSFKVTVAAIHRIFLRPASAGKPHQWLFLSYPQTAIHSLHTHSEDTLTKCKVKHGEANVNHHPLCSADGGHGVCDHWAG